MAIGKLFPWLPELPENVWPAFRVDPEDFDEFCDFAAVNGHKYFVERERAKEVAAEGWLFSFEEGQVANDRAEFYEKRAVGSSTTYNGKQFAIFDFSELKAPPVNFDDMDKLFAP